MRQAYAVVRLCERYGDARIDALCGRALAFDVLDVSRIERMAKTAAKVETDGANEGRVVALPVGRFARDTSAFATRTRGEGGTR